MPAPDGGPTVLILLITYSRTTNLHVDGVGGNGIEMLGFLGKGDFDWKRFRSRTPNPSRRGNPSH